MSIYIQTCFLKKHRRLNDLTTRRGEFYSGSQAFVSGCSSSPSIDSYGIGVLSSHHVKRLLSYFLLLKGTSRPPANAIAPQTSALQA
jgi:hypothetical protein